MKLTKILILLSLLSMSWSADPETYKKNQEKYCGTLKQNHWEMTTESRASKRSDNKTPMSIDFKIIKKAMDEGNY